MTDLISREALLTALATQLEGTTGQRQLVLSEVEAFVQDLPTARVQIVANITGGVLQGASSNHPAEIYVLDFDTDSFDEKATGIVVDGETAYHSGISTIVQPDFVRQVVEADTVFIHNEALVCGQCDGSGETQSASNLELEMCPVCDGTGERTE